MKLFKYKAFSKNKKIYIGEEKAKNTDELKLLLEERGDKLIVILKEDRVKSLKEEELKNFYMELGKLLIAGVSLKKGLEFCKKIDSSDMIRDLEDGENIGDILYRKGLLSEEERFILYISENTGKLGEGFIKIALFREKRLELKREFKVILSYPIFLLFISTIIFLFIFIFIVPNFIEIYQDMERELPLITKSIIFSYIFFKEYWYFILLLLLFLFIVLKKFLKSGKIWKIYPLKKLYIYRNIINLMENIGILLESGVSMEKSLMMVYNSLDEDIKPKFIKFKGIKNGLLLSEILIKLDFFSSTEIGMIQVGEESGNLSNMLLEVARQRRENIEIKTKIILKLVEPVVLLFIGILISLFVIGLYIPILNMSNVMER